MILDGAQIDIQANTTIGHIDVDDSMFAGNPGTITFNEDAFGDTTNMTNLQPATTKNKVVAYTLVFGDPPFKA